MSVLRRQPDSQRAGAPGASQLASLAMLLAVAGFLRFYQLDSQLWLDEIAAVLHSIRRPALDIMTEFPGFLPHALYELLAHASVLVWGESAWVVRLPAAVAGTGSVLLLYLLAARLAGRAEAFLAAGLMAVSYHHVFFSQNARGYTVMLFFSLLATLALLRLREGLSVRTRATYVIAATLAAYALPFGAFTLVGHLGASLPASLVWRRRGFGSTPGATSLVLLFAAAGAVVFLLYLPFAWDALRFTTVTGREAASGPRFSPALLHELVEGLRAGLGGTVGLVGASVIGLGGLLDYLRRRPFPLALLLAPTVVAALATVVLGVGVHPRYFLLVLPAGILIATRGLVILGGGAAGAAARLGVSTPVALRWALVGLVLVVATTPLPRYYRLPKQDYLGALREVRSLARDGDLTVAADLAAHAYRDYYAPGFPAVADLPDLLREEATGRRVWVVTTLERVLAHRQPDLFAHLRAHYRLVRVLPGTVGDGAMRIYVREASAPEAARERRNG